MNRIRNIFALLFLIIGLSFIPAAAQDWSNEQLATEYYQNKQYDKAIPYYQKMYDAKPSTYIYHNYLDCLNQTHDYKQAIKVIKKEMKRQPDNLVLWLDMGTAYQQEGDNKQMSESFDKAIRKLPPDRDEVIALGQAFSGIKQWDYALETYKKGKSLLHDAYPFLFETGEVYKQMGDFAKMTDSYLEALLISPSFVQTVEDALQYDAGENADISRNNAIKKELMRYVQRYPDNSIFSEMLVWMLLQEKNYADALTQVKALDRRNREGGWRLMAFARTCAADQAYTPAIDALQYVIDLGSKGDYYSQARVEQLNLMYTKLMDEGAYTNAQLLNLQTRYRQTISELGENAGTVPLILNMAHLDAFYLNQPDSAISMLARAAAIPGLNAVTRARCQMELADATVAAGRIWEASLIYSRIHESFKHDPIGEEANLKNAFIYFYTGNFKWAKAELDILKAATSKLTANDAMSLSLLIADNTQDTANTLPLLVYARAMLFHFRNLEDSALLLLDSVGRMNTESSLKEEALLLRADIAAKKGSFAEAAAYYEQEIKTYPDGMLPDKALFFLGQLEEKKLHNADKAADYYKQIILNYPGSFYVQDARDRYRSLIKTAAPQTSPVN